MSTSRSLSLLFSLIFCVTAVADDWPQYRGKLGDGKSAESIGDVQWPAEGPKVLWKAETPLGFSSFAVADGRAVTVVGVDGKETCLALDAQIGKELWSVALGSTDYGAGGGDAGEPDNRGGDGPRSTPSISGDRVYVYDAHLTLHCLDAATGKTVWKQDIAADFDGRNIRWASAASPLIINDAVYLVGGGAGQSFIALNKSDGSVIWKSGDETMTHATPHYATINEVPQVIFFVQSGLVAVDAATGKETWRAKFPYSVSTAASPVSEENLVYSSAGYGVGAGVFKVDGSEDAAEVWFKSNELMNHWSTPVVHDGHLYGIYEFKKYGKAPLQCVDLATGEIKWSERGFGPGNCILVGDKLVVLSDKGELVIAEARPDQYNELARAKVIEGKCWSTPAYSEGRVYVRSTKEAACIELR
ncbi:PQQ-binding-like beta-propeller repeat protein [Stieleria varia]|uniref:Outer membrane biogenesis protein BamB n=1 Tax=Stieleria varia TaxID=2528005 RepID=A0A5C6A516_9BACT|nr:PQQ-binding-like beta-propeller repeat protein [Stieleria varia]TWT94526.1 outer membrane biogenesis protein BamB [Stieleria varia]